MDIGQIRMLMRAQAVLSISKLILIMVAGWMVIISLCFRLVAPPNATTALSLAAAALLIAGAIFLNDATDRIRYCS